MPKKKIYLVIDHPDQVVNALAFEKYFPKQDFHLLINNHPYWKKNNFDLSSFGFASVDFIPMVRFSWLLPIEFNKILLVKNRLLSLNVNKNDIFLVFSNATFLEAILLSIYKNNKFVLIYPNHSFPSKKHKEKLISKIWNKTLIPLFKLPTINYYRHLQEPTMELVRYKKPRTNIFKKWIKIENDFSKKITGDFIYSLVPLIKNRSNVAKSGFKKKIVFFGASHKKNNNYHFDFTNKILRSLEKWYPNHEFVYKPHPNDTHEQTAIKLGKFSKYQGGLNTELYLLENVNKVAHSFSIESTSVAVALNFGISSYWFFELYEARSEVFKKHSKKILSFANPKSYLTSWKKPDSFVVKIPYKKIERALKKISSDFF